MKQLCKKFIFNRLTIPKRALAQVSVIAIGILFGLQSDTEAAEKKPPTSSTVTLTWTASGDDRKAGRASQYDIRYAKFPISRTNWDFATKAPKNNMTPKYSGGSESFCVTGLSPNTTYYFAMKVADEYPNWSTLSNVVWFKTTSPPMCGDIDESGQIDIADLVYLVQFMFAQSDFDFYHPAADFDQSGGIDISDLSYFVIYFFGDGYNLRCPY